MRFALVSDIHANRQAWESTLLDIRSLKIDQIICLGDIVGYGPCPAQVLESVHANVHHLVLGNHDAVVCHKLDDSLFNDTAQEIIRWTRERLNRDAVRFLRTLPLSLVGNGYRCSHGDLAEPAAFNYVIEPNDAMASWKKVGEPLLFIGHTHQPRLFLLGRSGTPHNVEPQDFQLEPEKRYIVNVGSVGQPRDSDARASYCVYDTETQSIFFRRIPFDLDAYRRDVEEAGIPIEGSYFLKHDPRQGVPPLREMFSFSPPTSPELLAKDVKPVEEIRILRRQAGRWRLLFLLLAIISVISTAWFYHLWRNRDIKSLDIRDPAMATITAADAVPGMNILQPFDTATPIGTPIPGWNVHLGNWKKQMFSLTSPKDMPDSLLLSSLAKDEIWVRGPMVRVQPGMKLTGALRMFVYELDGDITLYMVVHRERDGQPIADVHTASPGRKRRDGWLSAQKTITVPANATAMEYEVHGRFRGKVLIADLSLQVRPATAGGDDSAVESSAGPSQ
jgi:predicted phosphodiesterase